MRCKQKYRLQYYEDNDYYIRGIFHAKNDRQVGHSYYQTLPTSTNTPSKKYVYTYRFILLLLRSPLWY